MPKQVSSRKIGGDEFFVLRYDPNKKIIQHPKKGRSHGKKNGKTNGVMRGFRLKKTRK